MQSVGSWVSGSLIGYRPVSTPVLVLALVVRSDSDSLWMSSDDAVGAASTRRGSADAQQSRGSRRAHRGCLGFSSLQALFGASGLFIKISKY